MKYIFFHFLIPIIVLLVIGCDQKIANEKNELTPFNSPTSGNSSIPYLHAGDDKELYLTWISTKRDTAYYWLATLLNQETWSKPSLIAKGQEWFVNWADYPQISVNQKGDMVAHYLEKSGKDTYAYDIKVLTKEKFSNTWPNSQKLHEDSTQTEHGFVSFVPQGDAFLAVWLDGRNTKGGHIHNELEKEYGLSKAMTLRSGVINTNGKIIRHLELDDSVCDCCQTSAAVTAQGPVVVYRNRTENEIRDIYITRLVNDAWTIPKSIYDDNWQISGCPVNGPKVDAIGNNTVVAWFTASDDLPEVKVTFSSNAGESFDPPIVISSKETLGRVDIVMLNDSTAIVSWLEKEDRSSKIMAALVNRRKGITDSYVIAETTSSRASGFPQMEALGNNVYFGWTEEGDPSTIKTSKLTLHR